nr:hypothetical protein ICEMyc226_00188 [Mycolicibacterium sp.]
MHKSTLPTACPGDDSTRASLGRQGQPIRTNRPKCRRAPVSSIYDIRRRIAIDIVLPPNSLSADGQRSRGAGPTGDPAALQLREVLGDACPPAGERRE